MPVYQDTCHTHPVKNVERVRYGIDDRSDWQKRAGRTYPWEHEPDRIEWRTRTGLRGLIRRGFGGPWCGYVALSRRHRLHGLHGGAIAHALPYGVHGGVTHTGELRPHERTGLFWVGFDCGHAWDFVPDSYGIGREYFTQLEDDMFGRRVYRDVAYVRAEVEDLARQLTRLRRVPRRLKTKVRRGRVRLGAEPGAGMRAAYRSRRRRVSR